MTSRAFGIDFGGSGIKGAPVDLLTGDFAEARQRIDTPKPATPTAVATVIGQILDTFEAEARVIGVTVPGIVRHGVVGSAANIDPSWIDTDADSLLTQTLGRNVHVVNDADAAGIAEVRHGAAKGARGLVIVTTLGTGIGSALIYDGVLVPNSELGHLEIDGHRDIEKWAAASVRDKEELSWEAWAARLQVYYAAVEALFSPELIVVGGGVSKESAEFLPLLDLRTPIVPATLKNRAGIIGAAILASEERD